MELDLRKVANYTRRADTEELLDRVTVYRDEMEPAAVDLIEGELARRGLTPEEIADHDAQRRGSLIRRPDGSVRRCGFCDRPAVLEAWGWHRLWGKLPLFPRRFTYCETHAAN
jgi:hypothetical protein